MYLACYVGITEQSSRNFWQPKACWCIHAPSWRERIQSLHVYHYQEIGVQEWNIACGSCWFRYCTWYWGGCSLDFTISWETAVPKHDLSWSINPDSVLTIWKDSDDFSSRCPLAIEWTLDSYCITSSESAKVIGLSVIPFCHFGIVVVKDFLMALCCCSSFRVWLVED